MIPLLLPHNSLLAPLQTCSGSLIIHVSQWPCFQTFSQAILYPKFWLIPTYSGGLSLGLSSEKPLQTPKGMVRCLLYFPYMPGTYLCDTMRYFKCLFTCLYLLIGSQLYKGRRQFILFMLSPQHTTHLSIITAYLMNKLSSCNILVD